MKLKEKLGKKFVITTELGATEGVDVQTSIKNARSYQPSLDGINIHDCPGGRLRINSISLAHIIQEETGFETIPHFTCRDRSLLGTQADLLGAHALGIRYLLATTGDAPKHGPYPSTAVYNYTSLDLIRLIKKMNRGVDYNEKPFKGQTCFCVAATARPAAKNLDAEVERVRQKVEAGADFIQTQPVFHVEKAIRFMERVKDFKIPVLMGIMPLKSLKLAEFMNKNVPGIYIPPEVLEALARSERAAVEIACKFISEVYSYVDGIHIMAMGDVETTNILINYIRELTGE